MNKKKFNKIACKFSETTKTSINFEKVMTRHFLKQRNKKIKKDFIKKQKVQRILIYLQSVNDFAL